MSFAYKAMTEEQATKARWQLMEDGEYDAVVFDVIPKMSQNGNWMWEVYLNVYDKNGVVTKIRDFIVFSEKMMWKVIHFADSAGLAQEYIDEKLTPQMVKDANVRVQVKTQTGSVIPDDKLQGKPQGSKYPDKNVINDYVKRESQPAKVAKNDVPAAAPFNDDIPF